ncbi:tigger transposable element-derived protein 1-like [Parasteatoda tepidariorum]|uniref:tigger transposable element-derived protein 1-like n=1 Tax=Parasteatoda tepidariorum TaxID=114398 RepID=UPI0039BCD264
MERANVSVVFLPPNCTSILQLMDNGILRSFKCKYKTQFLMSMLTSLNGGQNLQDFVKSYSIKTAIWNIAKAWDEVDQKTLKNAWNNVWPATFFFGNDEDEPIFEGFRPNKEKDSVRELLHYIKSHCEREKLDEEDIVETLNYDDDAPTVTQLTDEEIKKHSFKQTG